MAAINIKFVNDSFIMRKLAGGFGNLEPLSFFLSFFLSFCAF
jgi:hypothetical protein